MLQDASGSQKNKSGSSDDTEKVKDVQIQFENVSPTEGLTCHAVDSTVKLEKHERDSNKSLQVLKKRLEEMAKKQEDAIIFLQKKTVQTKEGVLLLNEMHGKLKSDGLDGLSEIMTKELQEKIALRTQQIVQIKEDYVKAKKILARVDSIRDDFQFKVNECKKELIKQQKEVNEQLDREGATRKVKSPSKEDEDEII